MAWVATAAILAFAPVALAADPQAAVRARARAHYRAGDAAQKAGRYDDAVAEYRAAYELLPLPGLLFNIGQAYRLKGDKVHALEAYRKYLDVEPDGRASPEAREHIAALDAAVAAQAKEREPAPADKPPEPAPPPAPPPVVPTTVEPEPIRPPVVDRAPAVASGSGSTLRYAGIATGIAGVGLVVGGVIVNLHAKSLQNDIEAMYSADTDSSGKAANRTMIILYSAGAAAIVTGGILYYLGARADEPKAVTFAPTVWPVGLAAQGHF